MVVEVVVVKVGLFMDFEIASLAALIRIPLVVAGVIVLYLATVAMALSPLVGYLAASFILLFIASVIALFLADFMVAWTTVSLGMPTKIEA